MYSSRHLTPLPSPTIRTPSAGLTVEWIGDVCRRVGGCRMRARAALAAAAGRAGRRSSPAHRRAADGPRPQLFDKSDITVTEAFRKELNARHGGEGAKVTLLAFMINWRLSPNSLCTSCSAAVKFAVADTRRNE
jgi:hypothetical protein